MRSYSEPSGREDQVIVLNPFLRPGRDVRNMQVAVFASYLSLPPLASHRFRFRPGDERVGSVWTIDNPEVPERGLLWHLTASTGAEDPTRPSPAQQLGNLIVATSTLAEVRDVADEWVSEGVTRGLYTGDDASLAARQSFEQGSLTGQHLYNFIRSYTISPRD